MGSCLAHICYLLMKLLVSILSRYFESGVCSVYLWDLDHGFAGVVLIKKAGDTERTKGCWDSIHVIEVQVILHYLLCVHDIRRNSRWCFPDSVLIGVYSSMESVHMCIPESIPMQYCTSHYFVFTSSINTLNVHTTPLCVFPSYPYRRKPRVAMPTIS